jgi:acetyl esterase/lipase
MDLWLAKSEKPTPLLVSIHGGGFNSGDRGVDYRLLPGCLKSDISVAAITYRLSGEAKAPAQFLDSARAVQFIRSKAKEWNLDPSRIAATGSSAGAGISLWLAFHDDLANPTSDDPVLRQSTRLTSAVTYDGQTSYDPRFIRELSPGTETYKNGALAMLFDVDLNKLEQLPDAKHHLFEEVSPLHDLTKDDAPVLLIYTRKFDTPLPKPDPGVGIHHPLFGKALKKKMDAVGIECQVATDIQLKNDAWGTLAMDFLKKHFGVK